jgi:hypothetical protein
MRLKELAFDGRHESGATVNQPSKLLAVGMKAMNSHHENISLNGISQMMLIQKFITSAKREHG